MLKMIRQLAGDMLAMLRTRAELAAVEVEEAVVRLVSYLLFSLIALACFGMTVLLASLLIILIFWDTHRIAAVAGLLIFFGAATAIIALSVRRCFRNRPRFLSATFDEVAQDIAALKNDEASSPRPEDRP